MSCKVNGCRFKTTHTTIHHRCGNCHENGHGRIECNNNRDKLYLKKYFEENILINKYCEYCNSKNHITKAHLCLKCDRFHSEKECIIQDLSVYKNRLSFIDNIKNIDNHKILNHNKKSFYIVIYAGMGCSLYIVKKYDSVISIFMHSDCWGQYGESTNDKPILDGYINGLEELNINKFLTCPIKTKN